MSTMVVARVALLAALAVACVQAYQDSGKRNITLWPPPNTGYTFGKQTYVIADPCSFQFNVESGTLSAAKDAVSRYHGYIFADCREHVVDPPKDAAILSSISVSVKSQHYGPPAADINETYVLIVEQDDVDGSGKKVKASLSAETYVGLLRGLETFSQLVILGTVEGYPVPVYHVPGGPWQLEDRPRFSHRGLLVDVARSFLSVNALKQILDGMQFSKLNVLHLHLTDSQAFPIELESEPAITLNGAVNENEVYSQDNIADLISFATSRGVRVVPEIDTPGHSRAFGLAPEYNSIVSCTEVEKWSTCCAEPPCGQLNPAVNLTYKVLSNVLGDVMTMFPDRAIHVGYDEVNFNCWEQDPVIQKYVKEKNMTMNDLLAEFFHQQREILRDIDWNRTVMYWEEAAKQNLSLKATDVVQVWSDQSALKHILTTTPSQLIISWAQNVYMDCGLGNMFGSDSWCDPFKTWWTMYNKDPLEGVDAKYTSRVLGGEAAMWGELVNEETVSTRVWPRAAAYGARLWSYDHPLSREEASLATQGHADRLNQRGVPASNVLLPFCQLQPDLCFKDPTIGHKLMRVHRQP